MGESFPLRLKNHGDLVVYLLSDIRAVEKPRIRRDDVQGDALQVLGIREWRRQGGDGAAF
jgi:hypothetical protein